ncbi:hypothetical protein CQY20_06310 [Mycolicibacterium agri]|uniref:L,D-TPase catalytic domain-containing protein n=1 Tax=Mycolicibacterium agri TaxID=36811 RepID=A0A2A7NBV8_MYCAG|nr:Ig-like domain-containing protein [Mycolicibacterium agri]PEG40948.1 hypothetical protein CQY20_06310 [Mycolicibacterium agri]
MFWSRRVRVAALVVAVAASVLLAGDVAAINTGCPAPCQVATAAHTLPSPPAPKPATLKISPRPGSEDVNPASGISVAAFSGTLEKVTMVNDAGKEIPGVLSRNKKGWRPAAQLGYGRTYTMTIHARGPRGMPTRQTSSFTTVSPDYQASVYLNTIGGAPIQDGGTYGIGTVVVARFDSKITDRVTAEKRLRVTTDPPVVGAWNWVDDQTAHWRPEKYYAPGTKVTVSADIYGARLGDGLYGEEDKRVSFKIGNAHVAIADDTTKHVDVYDNGKLVRSMPTSMGKGGTQTIGGTTLHFWTPPGVYTVLDKANPVVMDSTTYGLTGAGGYRTTVPYATRISIDGIYLHQLDATIWAQGNTNVSHGCLNLSGENAKWFFDFAVPGDIVEVRNTGGPPLTLSQGGDWSVPWDEWRKGSALNN